MATGFQPSPPPSEETTLTVTRGGGNDAALLRVSVEIARQFPRDEARIVAQLSRTLDAYPQFAERALYSIPYQDRRTGRTVRVEGLTIRAAETLEAAWGNLRCGVRFTDEDDSGVNVEAVVFDMERNIWEMTPGRALKVEKSREGRMTVLDERRFLQARGSAGSKAKRNAILAVLPLHIKAWFESRVREIMAGGDLNKPANPEKIAAAIAAFAEDFQVTVEQLEKYVNKPKGLWVGKDVVSLKGLYNGLDTGETTVAEAFAPPEPVLVVTPLTPAGGIVIEAKSGQLGSTQPPTVIGTVTATTNPVPPVPETLVGGTPAWVTPPPAFAPKPTRPRGRPRNPRTVATEVPPSSGTSSVPLESSRVDPEPTPEVLGPPTLVDHIATLTTPEACDDLLGRIYESEMTREAKQDALRRISARRNELQSPS